MSLEKHFNLLYSGTTPLNLGDRYYSQDLIRDLLYGWDNTGQTARRILGTFPARLAGGVVTKGAGDTLNITEAWGVCNYSVEHPDTFAALPPSKTSSDVARLVHAAAQTNMALAAATLNGVATNYIKLKYAETDGNTRTRARAAGTYSYEVAPSYTYVVSTAAATDYDVVLGTLVGTAGGAFTIVQTANPVYNLFSTQTDLDTAEAAIDVIEKKHGITNSAVAVAAYTIADDDNTNDIFANPAALAFAVNLPTLAANIGRIIRVKVIAAGGAVSLTPEGAETIDGVNAAFVMQSSGDNCTVVGQATGWRILSAYARLDTGWIQRSDWVSELMGSQLVTVASSAGYTMGETVTESTSSNTGIIIANAGNVLTLKNVTGTGVFTNGRTLTGTTSGVGGASTVNGNTINQDTNVVHYLGVSLSNIYREFIISTDMAEANIYSTKYFIYDGWNGGTGIIEYGADTNSYIVKSGSSGIGLENSGGTGFYLDGETYYYKHVVERKI
jgi:hypothetical protein